MFAVSVQFWAWCCFSWQDTTQLNIYSYSWSGKKNPKKLKTGKMNHYRIKNITIIKMQNRIKKGSLLFASCNQQGCFSRPVILTPVPLSTNTSITLPLGTCTVYSTVLHYLQPHSMPDLCV